MPERGTDPPRGQGRTATSTLKLIESQLPELGQCKFADYFTAAIGADAVPEVHGELHLEDVEHPGRRARDVDGLGRPLPSRLHQDRRARRAARARRLRSDQVRGSHARQRHPLPGLSRSTAGTRSGARWSRASTVIRDRIVGIEDEHKQPYVLLASGEKHYFADYHTVFCSIDIDELWGEDTLPYTGRMMIPLLIPGLANAFPGGRRVAALLVVRVPDARDRDEGDHAARQPGHADSDRSAGAARARRSSFRGTPIDYALEHNLFAEKAYPQQSEQAFATYYSYVERGKKIPNLRYVGRHAEFKYWGMPETVNSAYQKSLEFPPV